MLLVMLLFWMLHASSVNNCYAVNGYQMNAEVWDVHLSEKVLFWFHKQSLQIIAESWLCLGYTSSAKKVLYRFIM